MSERKPLPCSDCASNSLRLVHAEGQLREAQHFLERAARGQAKRSATRLAKRVLRKMSEWVRPPAERSAQDEREDVVVYLLDRAKAAFPERAVAFCDAAIAIRNGQHGGAAELDRKQLAERAEFPR